MLNYRQNRSRDTNNVGSEWADEKIRFLTDFSIVIFIYIFSILKNTKENSILYIKFKYNGTTYYSYGWMDFFP